MLRLLLLMLTCMLVVNHAQASECGVFRVVKKKVFYKPKAGSKFKRARVNKKVCSGDTVKTEKDARAKIQFPDKNELNISPATEMVIEQYSKAGKDKQVMLNVINGKVRANVRAKYRDDKKSFFRVKTKSAVAGVRGTEFLTSFNRAANESRVVTFEGQVSVAQFKNGAFTGAVVVRPGQFTSNKPGVDPHPPRNVPKAELAQIDQDSNIESPSESGGAGAQPNRDVSNDPEDQGGDDAGKDQQQDQQQEPSAGSEGGEKPEANNNEPGASDGGGREPASVDNEGGAPGNEGGDGAGGGGVAGPDGGGKGGIGPGPGGEPGFEQDAGGKDEFFREPASTDPSNFDQLVDDIEGDILPDGSTSPELDLGEIPRGPNLVNIDNLNGVPTYQQDPLLDNVIQNQNVNVIINIEVQ